MKKELAILTLALAPTISMAAGTATPGSTTVLAGACTLLQDDLRVQLSNGVVGAYNCNTGAGFIALAACHTAGRVASRSAIVQTPNGCGGTTTVQCTGTSAETKTGASVPVATTQGGSMVNNFPGSNCDTAGATAAGQI